MAWWFGRRAERELDDEIAAHLEMAVHELVARGETREAAEAIARRQFGNLTAIREAGREAGGSPLVERALEDVRHALRRLRAQPGAAVLASLLLALAIGVSAAMFTIVDAFLIHPAPFADAETLAVARLSDDESPGNPNLPLPVIRAWRSAAPFRAVHAAAQQPVTFGAGDEVQTEGGALITPGLIEELGAAPLLGRTFLPREGAFGDEPIAILAEPLWRARFGGDPAIVGRRIAISGEPVLIVGVMPASFAFPFARTRVWRPLDLDRPPARLAAPGSRAYAYVRLDRGVPTEDIARAAFDAARSADPTIRTGRVTLPSIVMGSLDAYSAAAVRALAAGVALVFLVLSLNVTTLMLARLGGRRHELALCSALGASRGRLLRQALWEQLLVGGAASAIGLALAAGLVALARAGLPADFVWRTLNPLDLDARAVAAAAALSLAATIIAGVLPAWLATRRETAGQLHEISHGSTADPGRQHLTRLLVAGEIALVLALAVAAGVQWRSFVNLLAADRGMDVDRLVTFALSLPGDASSGAAGRLAAASAVRADLEGLPGVEGATVSFGVPPGGGSLYFYDVRADRADARAVRVVAHSFRITADFLRVYGVRLIDGRAFAPGDPPGSVILSRSFAAALWPNASAVGRVLRFDNRAFTVVGVTSEIRNPLVDPREDPPEMFEPLVLADAATGAPGIAPTSLHVTVRCGAGCPPPEQLRVRIRATAASAQVGGGRHLRDDFAAALERPRAGAVVAVAFAAVSLVAAGFGLFAVLSRAMLERRRELGIRAALGAAPGDLRALVYRSSLTLAAAGLLSGSVLAAVLGRVLASIQYGVGAIDPLIWAASIALILLTAAIAARQPARHAMRADPVALLRRE